CRRVLFRSTHTPTLHRIHTQTHALSALSLSHTPTDTHTHPPTHTHTHSTTHRYTATHTHTHTHTHTLYDSRGRENSLLKRLLLDALHLELLNSLQTINKKCSKAFISFSRLCMRLVLMVLPLPPWLLTGEDANIIKVK